jgi:hypothetical protein
LPGLRQEKAMTPGEYRDAPAGERDPFVANAGSLRVALLFGAAAVVVALLVAPLAEDRSNRHLARNADNVDRMATGSVRNGGNYTVRKSVLQAKPNSVCIIHRNGTRAGDC